MNRTIRFLKAAGISLALAITFSCSDDDDSGGYVSCEKLKQLSYACEDQYCPDYDNDCDEERTDQCIERQVCGGVSWDECMDYYYDECANHH